MKIIKVATLILLSVVLLSAVACQSNTYSLYTSANGQGSITPSGGTFSNGDDVTLVAIPASGWEFSHWEGDYSGSQNSVRIHMDSSKTVVAFFSQAGMPSSTPTPVVYPTQTPSPTSFATPSITPSSTGTSSGGLNLNFVGDNGAIFHRDSNGNCLGTTFYTYLSNSGEPGNVFVEVKGAAMNNLIASKVFYINRGEQVTIMFNESGCSSGAYNWTARAALPGDISQREMTVERGGGS